MTYTGDNSHLEDVVPRGNETRCEIIEVKLKDGTKTLIKNYHGKKVRMVLADQVEYLKLKKINKPKQMTEIKDALVRQISILNDATSSDRDKKLAENKINTLKKQTKRLEQLRIFNVEPKKKRV